MSDKKTDMQWHKSKHTGAIEVFGYFLDLAVDPKEEEGDTDNDRNN